MPQEAVSNRCGVCRRPLSNPFSMRVGVGPTCAKKVRKELAQRLQEAREAENNGEIVMLTEIMRNFRFVTPSEMEQAVIHDVRQGYLQNRRRPRPSATPVTVQTESRSRSRANENIRVEWIDADTALTISDSGHTYQTTAHACNCADYTVHHGSYNENGEHVGSGGGFCRHMVALEMARRDVAERRRTAYRNRRLRVENNAELPVHTDVSLQSQTPVRGRFGGHNNVENLEATAHEENRDVMLGHDYNEHIRNSEARTPLEYVDYVSNDQAWTDLEREALTEEPAPLNLNEPLYETTDTWGVEFETHFPNQAKMDACLQDLYQEGFIYSPRVSSYHNYLHDGAPASWNGYKVERDGSLGDTYPSFELVSPKLTDSKEEKEDFLKVTKIMQKHGAFQSSKCGTHFSTDQKGLSDDPWAMQREARTLVQFEHIIAQVASADPVKYKTYGIPKNDLERERLAQARQEDEQSGRVRTDAERMAEHRHYSIREAQGAFRHGTYTAPFSSNLSFGGNLSINGMRRAISPDRYTMVAFRDEHRIEWRVNQGLDGDEMLRKGRIYDAIKSVGRDIRNENQGAEYSARFSERNKQIRINGDTSQYQTRLRELCTLVRNKNVAKDIIRFCKMGRV